MPTPFRPALILALLACLAAPAWSYRVLARYDLDSLYYLSQIIVKAQVGNAQPQQTADGNCVVYDVKVLEVLKGDATVGKTYKVTGLDAFNHAPGLPGRPDGWERLQPGDVVYLFAVPNGKTGYAMYKLVDADWSVLESGARLQAGGDIYAFGQDEPDAAGNRPEKQGQIPMAAQVAMTPAIFPKPPVYSDKDFHARLVQAASLQSKLDQSLKADASDALLQSLVQMLQARPALLQAESAKDDSIGIALARRLTQIATDKPEVLDAVYQSASRVVRRTLAGGFANGQGITYLLQHVVDDKAPMDKRLAWAEVLTETARAFARLPALRDAGVPDDLDVRLAKLATANLDNALGTTLLPGLVAPGMGRTPSAAVVTVLKEGYATAKPPQQFAIAESVMLMDLPTYRNLFTQLGTFLTFAQPGPDFARALQNRTLSLTFRYRGTPYSPLKIALRPLAGGPDRLLEPAAQPDLPRNGSTVGSGWQLSAPLPADIPAGKYTIFLHGNGDGIGFEVEVPNR